MFCPNCGNQVEEGTKFCANCGEKIGSEVNTPAELVVSKNPDPFAEKCFVNENPVEYSGEYSTKTKTVAGLFAFFLGGFGAMDFYVGKSGNGIVKLILTHAGIVIGALIILIRFIRYKSDMFEIAKELARDPVVALIYTFTVLCPLITLIWNISDMFEIAKENYYDKNGLPLAGDPAVVTVLAILQTGLLILSVICVIFLLCQG